MEYALLNQSDIALFIWGLITFGAFIVGLTLGYLAKNYEMLCAMEALEDRLEKLTGTELDDIFDEYK